MTGRQPAVRRASALPPMMKIRAGTAQENSLAFAWLKRLRFQAVLPLILIVAPEDLGAGGHALGTNLSVMGRYVFDWLDEAFA